MGNSYENIIKTDNQKSFLLLWTKLWRRGGGGGGWLYFCRAQMWRKNEVFLYGFNGIPTSASLFKQAVFLWAFITIFASFSAVKISIGNITDNIVVGIQCVIL